jgi:NTE family protein
VTRSGAPRGPPCHDRPVAHEGTPGAAGHRPAAGLTAFVLGGGGLLGATEIGMLQALFDAGHRPDLVVGTSVGALNGAVVASDPTPECIDRLTHLWQALATSGVFRLGLGLRDVARYRTHLHPITPLQRLLDRELGPIDIGDLAVPFQCCAASIERAAETWFAEGRLSAAVAASCAVPGLFPPVEIGGEHYLDGGLVNSIPVSRAIELGATRVFVLHVGRIGQPLQAPRRPWEVALVAFEIARRHRFARDMADVPPDVEVHVLPAGDVATPTANLRYRDTRRVRERVLAAQEAAAAYLAELGVAAGPGREHGPAGGRVTSRSGSGPDAGHPDATQPDAASPDAAQPDAAHPDAADPDAARPGAEAASATQQGAEPASPGRPDAVDARPSG